MNKETIYIEPSDDITDILSRIKASDKKIIALVPPKKPSVLLSSINIKLIARAAKSAKKAIVLVTTNDSLTKLAMTANLPVAPSLKSRPIMPGEEAAAKNETEAENEEPEDEDDDDDKPDEEDQDKDGEEDGGKDEKDEESEEDDEEDEEDAPDEDDKDKDGEIDDNEEDEDNEEEDDEEDEPEQPSKKPDKKPAKKANKSEKEHDNAFIAFLINHKIWFIVGAATLVVLILFLVWAFTIAPRVKVSVSVRTASGNFSENVSFTKKLEDESSDTGSFYLHEEKIEKDQVVKFTATGKKDLGEPASGSLVVFYYFSSYNSPTIEVGADTTFTYNGMNYTPTSTVTLTGPSAAKQSAVDAVCENAADYDFANGSCLVSATISVKAAAPGEDYNISDETDYKSWATTIAGLYAYSKEPISGGTSKIVTVVQQSDVDLALDKLKSESTSGDKEELYGKLSDTVMPVEATFKIVTSDPQTTPAVGEEVKEGVTPQVSTKTVSSVYTIDRVRVEEFITKKANLEEGKRLYSYGEPFIEYFAEASNDTYTGKLKTTYRVGPEISETEVLDKIRGEKIGRIEPILKDAFSGISSVKTEKSYFWVNSIPNDENKVEINLTVEE